MNHFNLKGEGIGHDENATSNSNEQTNSNTTVNMDLVEKEETVGQGKNMMVKSKNFRCIDVENSVEPPADKIDDTKIDIGLLVNVTDPTNNGINPNDGKGKFTIMGMYETMFGAGQQRQPPQQQQLHVPRYTRQLWRQEPPPNQPQQTTWTQNSQFNFFIIQYLQFPIS